VIVVVAVAAQPPAAGVYVRTILPAPATAGSKKLPLTPGPDHVPPGKFGSSKVVRSSSGSLVQTVAVAKTGVPPLLTVIVVVAVAAQLPAAGVYVSTILPAPATAGLKKLPLTPGPDHVPPGKFGSSKVVRSSSGSLVQTVAVAKTGVPPLLTVIVVVAVAAQLPAAGVYVRTILPAPATAGSKKLPLTPGPDHVPRGKFGSSKVVRSSSGSLVQMLVVPSSGGVAAVTVMVAIPEDVQPPDPVGGV
jgi:hypothetical protein